MRLPQSDQAAVLYCGRNNPVFVDKPDGLPYNLGKGVRTMTVTNEEKILEMLARIQENMDHMQGNMDRMQGNMDRMQADISDMKADISRLDTRVGRLETKVDNLEIKVGRLETKVDRLETKVDTLTESEEVTRDGVNTLLEWAENVGQAIRFPLPRLGE